LQFLTFGPVTSSPGLIESLLLVGWLVGIGGWLPRFLTKVSKGKNRFQVFSEKILVLEIWALRCQNDPKCRKWAQKHGYSQITTRVQGMDDNLIFEKKMIGTTRDIAYLVI
jgi:hypothetical protein